MIMELKGVSVYSSSAQGRRRSISDGEMELTGLRLICNSSVNWLAWRESEAGSFLVTGNDDKTVRMWRVTEEEGKPCFKLQWSSPHGSLNVKDANIQNAHGLSRMQIQLLKQRGSVGEPTPPLSIRSAGEKLISMAATVNRLSMAPKKELLNDRAGELLAVEAEPKVSRKDAELVVEE